MVDERSSGSRANEKDARCISPRFTHPLSEPFAETLKQALVEGIRARGIAKLPWSQALRQWQARVILMREVEGDVWLDVSDESLEQTLSDWLAPYLDGLNQPQDLSERTFAPCFERPPRLVYVPAP